MFPLQVKNRTCGNLQLQPTDCPGSNLKNGVCEKARFFSDPAKIPEEYIVPGNGLVGGESFELQIILRWFFLLS